MPRKRKRKKFTLFSAILLETASLLGILLVAQPNLAANLLRRLVAISHVDVPAMEWQPEHWRPADWSPPQRTPQVHR